MGPYQTPGLIDSNIVIDDARGLAAATAFLATVVAREPLTFSVVTAMELMRGCRDARALAQIRQLLSVSSIIQIDPLISEAAYDLVERFTLSHRLDIPDALIAATALVLGMPLYTRNVRDFAMIPGLAVVRPY